MINTLFGVFLEKVVFKRHNFFIFNTQGRKIVIQKF